MSLSLDIIVAYGTDCCIVITMNYSLLAGWNIGWPEATILLVILLSGIVVLGIYIWTMIDIFRRSEWPVGHTKNTWIIFGILAFALQATIIFVPLYYFLVVVAVKKEHQLGQTNQPPNPPEAPSNPSTPQDQNNNPNNTQPPTVISG